MEIDYQLRLKQEGIPFEVKNNGKHLIVEGTQGYVDVWPTTGKWMDRTTQDQGFGLLKLVEWCKPTPKTDVVLPPIQISLNHGVAMWLKGLMQNPIQGEYEDEDGMDKVFREEVFNAIPIKF